MTIVDWTGADAGPVAGLYDEESRYWRKTFGWDTSEQWGHIETARTTWGLPGLLAMDECGRPCGWLYYLRTIAAGVQLGGVTATDTETTAALVSRVTRLEGGLRLSAFSPARAPGLATAFEQAGWRVTPHLYLTRSIADLSPGPDDGAVAVRPWRTADAELAPGILRDAYAGLDARMFAPDGSAEAWRSYVRGLTEQTGCGRFLPGASGVALADGCEIPTGVVLTTAIAEHAAHVAQIGVSRPTLAPGSGRSLLGYAMRHAAAAGHATLSLLVSAANARARRFYQAAGFIERGRFLQAERAPSALPVSSAFPVEQR